MEAKEFIKKFGWDYARSLVSKLNINDTFYLHDGGEVSVLELKTLVDAWELVESRGGLSEAKAIGQQYWNSEVGSAMFVAMEIKQAIELVESCNV